MILIVYTMADNWSEPALRPLLLQWQGCVAKLTQTSTLSLWPSNTTLLPFVKTKQLGWQALAQWLTAHSRVILVFQDSCGIIQFIMTNIKKEIFSPGMTEQCPNVSLLLPSLKLSPGSTLARERL